MVAVAALPSISSVHEGAEVPALDFSTWLAEPAAISCVSPFDAWYNNWFVPLIDKSVAESAFPVRSPEKVEERVVPSYYSSSGDIIILILCLY